MASPAAVLNILITANTAQATASLARTETQLKKTSATANTASTAMGSRLAGAAKMGAAAVGVGLVYAMGKAVKVGADFEKQMDAVGAVANANAKEMKKLEKQALSLGQKTSYSALEVAQAQEELVKGGLKLKDVLGGALPAALSLAAAGQMELGDSAATTVNAMKLFGLEGKKAMQVADMLATAANKTTADVDDFAMALQQGGSVAKLAGINLNQTVTALEALAESGIKNSDAGTSLKTAFIQLLKPTEKQAALAEQLNIEWVNGQGNLKSMSALSKELSDATDGMTNAQRAATFATLAGTDGVRTLNALYAAGPDKLRALTDANREQGTAQDIARQKMDNLAGSMEQLGGALQTLAIKFSQLVSPAIRSGVDWLTGALTDLSKLKMDELMKDEDVRGFAEAFSAIGGAVKTWWEKITLPILQKAGPYIKQYFGGLARVIGGFVEVVAGILSLDFKMALGGMKNIVKGAFDEVVGLLGIITAPFRHAFAKVGSIAADAFRKPVEGVVKVVGWVFDKVMGTFSSFLRVAAAAADKLSGIPIIGSKFDGLADAANNAADRIDGFRESLRGDDSAISKEAASLKDLAGVFKDLGRDVRDTAEQIADQVDKIVKNFDRTSDKSRSMGQKVGANITGMASVVTHGLQIVIDNTNKALKGFGVKKVAISLAGVGSAASGFGKGFQTGGVIVPGQGNGDKVPAMLEPGEVVINKKAVQAMGGASRVNSINRKIPRFAKGGVVTGDTDYVPQLGSALNSMSASSGRSIYVQSGRRTLAEQTALYNAYLNGTGNLAAPPSPNAPHVQGIAADISPGREVFGSMAGKFGLGFTVPSESWHIQLLDGKVGAAMEGAKAHIERVLLKGPDGPLKDLGQAALDKALKAARAYVASRIPTSSAGGGFIKGGGGDVVGQIAKVLLGGGLNRTGAAAIIGNAYQESGWNPGAMEPGTDNGGLWGFTTSPVALADVRNYANAKNMPWDNATLQSNFLLKHLSPAHTGYSQDFVNQLNSLPLAPSTALFMNEWERPNAAYANYPNRLSGAQKALSMFARGGVVQRLQKGGEGKKDLGGAVSGGKTDSAWKRFSKARRIAQRLKDILGERGRVAKIDESIGIAETLAGLDSSPGGSDLSPEELAKQIRLNEHLLEVLTRARKLAASGMRELHFPKGMSTAAISNPQLKGLKGTLGSYLTDLTGVTGKGGRIFDTKVHLNELRHTSTAVDNSAQIADLAELLRQANARYAVSQAQYGVFDGFRAKGGRIGAGKWAIAGERGPEPVMGPATVLPNSSLGGTPTLTIQELNVYENGKVGLKVGGREFEAAVMKVNRKQARSGGRVLPGRAGS